MLERRPALGKGLSALIPDAPEPIRYRHAWRSTSICCHRTSSSRGCTMDDARLEELAQSIKSNGIIQPILVRRDGAAYRIIAGERRWRAAQRAGLQRVPVVVSDVAARRQAVARARADREPPAREPESGRRSAGVSAARRRLLADAGPDRRGGRQGSQFGRELHALLRLPEEVRGDLATGALSTGHARALLPLPDAAAQRQAAREVIPLPAVWSGWTADPKRPVATGDE